MKKYLIFILIALCCLALAACGCEHSWAPATCEKPKTCTLCGDTEGAPAGHSWFAATCQKPKTCEICSTTEGAALGHNFADATCTDPRTCRDCAATDGHALGHNWLDATTDAPKTCKTCSITEGDPIKTDIRFQTEKSRIVFGSWSADLVLPMDMVEPALAKYDPQLEGRVTLHFKGDGTMTMSIQVQDNQILRDALVSYTIDKLYSNMAALGIPKNAAEQKFQEMYGMPIGEYAAAQVAGSKAQDMIGNTTQNFVYYVNGGTLFVCANWNGIMNGHSVAVVNGQLLLSMADGDSVAFYQGE